MEPDVANLAGGLTGVLVMWNRMCSRTGRRSKLRHFAVLTLGTAASASALIAFTKVLGPKSNLYAATIVILITGWTAVLNSVVPVSIPPLARRARAREFAVLGAPWTRVRSFGSLLRTTPLRHLAGQVYLSQSGGSPLPVLGGIREAQAVHLWAHLLSCPCILYWVMQRQWTSLICRIAIHAPLNVNPVLHLRHVSLRLERLVGRRRRSEAAQPGTPRNRGPATWFGKPGVSKGAT